ncbi:anaphase-promoting complex subunit 6-like isoform X2 [Malus domestica]|uniref:anaphase-promoting complex subunit 6-like isoform X2 n=1 Tax=Malus domestica TaxID=3750 RepID=UPI00397653F2
MYLDKDGEDHEINISSAICFLRGKAYEALENRVQARQWLWNVLLRITCLHATKFLMQAKTTCPSDPLVYNEPGVVAYHLKEIYEEAIKFYEKALALSTRSVSTYAVLAYAYHLQDNLNAAITYYQKAPWLKPDDQFCTEMLSVALVDDSRRGVDSGTEFLRLNTCLVLRCFYKKWV